jgi:hypothetical protein
MAQEIINIGPQPNDGQGDNLRTAFDKTNDNFDQIWTAGPVGSNVRIAGNTISTLQVNQDLALSPNGTGNVRLNNNTIPGANNTWFLGSATNQWRGIYANTVTAGNVTISSNLAVPGDVTIGGNLTVEGDTIQIGNIVTDTKTIQLSNTATTTAAANGSGITVGANDNIATMLYSSISNVWAMNIGANITGNVTAPYFFGNGSQLTGLPVQYGNANVVTLLSGFGSNTISTTGNITAGYLIGNGSQLTGVTSYANANVVAYGQAGWAGNIIPSGNAVYSLGNATNQWNDLYVSNTTIFMNNVPITLGAGNVLTVNGNAVLQNNSNSTISTTGNITSGNVLTGGIVSATGNVSGNYFIGNGSQLTGLSTSSISNGLSNVAIPTANGNVTVTANGTYTWSFEDTGTLIFPASPNGQIYGGLDNDFIITTANANAATYYFTFSQFGDLTVPINLNVSGNAYVSDIMGPGNSNVTVTANTQSWLFETDGRLFLPNDGVINASGNSVDIGSDDAISLEANAAVNIYTDTNGTAYQWTFGTDGNLTLPAGGIVYETNIPDGGLSGSAIALKPTGGTNADQELLIYPTVNDANHLHLTTGNLYNTELFLGDDNLYVKLANTGNVVINSNDDVGNSAQWTFGTGGTTQFPGSKILAPVSQSITMQSDQYSQLMWENANVTVAPNMAINSNFYVSQNNATLDIAKRDGSGTQVTKSWYWNADGTLTLPTAGRINFDYLSISSDANVSAFYAPAGNVQLAAGIGDAQIVANSLNDSKTWTFGNTGNLTAPGNVSAVGNITAGNLNVGSGTINGGNFNGANFNGNVAFGAGVIGGSGNITGGNILTTGIVSATGNVSGNFFIGNGSQLTGIAASYGNANVATFLAAYGSNTISTTGNITAGNLIGNISITGNVQGTSANVTLVAGAYSWTFDNTGNTQGNLSLTGSSITINNAPGGNEGAEIQWALPSAANTVLTTSLIQDVYQNGMRFFEGGGNTRGLYMDLGNVPNGAGTAVGYRDVPQVSFTGNATLAATDAGRHYYSTLATANTLTIANNTSVSWSVGTAISIVNRGSGNITIAQGSGVSLYLAGNATAGNRTVTTYGMATLLNVAANIWMINGSGVS